MKYQLLLLTIYLITITYCVEDPCEEHGTSSEYILDTTKVMDGWICPKNSSNHPLRLRKLIVQMLDLVNIKK